MGGNVTLANLQESDLHRSSNFQSQKGCHALNWLDDKPIA